jgi:UDP-glucuronate decarboxylase
LIESGDDITGPVNLGNPHEVSINEIARLTLRQTGSRSPLRYRALPQDDPKRRRPVIRKATQLLGWRPVVPLEDGLRAIISYFSLRVFTPDDEEVFTSLRAVRARRPRRLALARAQAMLQ